MRSKLVVAAVALLFAAGGATASATPPDPPDNVPETDPTCERTPDQGQQGQQDRCPGDNGGEHGEGDTETSEACAANEGTPAEEGLDLATDILHPDDEDSSCTDEDPAP